MAGHKVNFWSGHERAPCHWALPWWSCAVFMPRTPHVCLQTSLSIPDLHPWLFDISTYTCNTHLRCNLFKLNSWSFPPNLFHFHHSPAQDWLVILLVAQVNYFTVIVIFSSFIFYLYSCTSVSKIYPVSQPSDHLLVWAIMLSSPLTWTIE